MVGLDHPALLELSESLLSELSLSVPSSYPRVMFDGADAGVGDLVLVNVDGGAAKMLLGDKEIIADNTVCGVIDHWTFDGKVTGK